MSETPEGYVFSDREELAPLVRDFHEMMGRDLSEGEVLALDFALEWTWEWAETHFTQALQEDFAVSYGSIPNVRIMNMPSFEVAVKVARALNGQVRVRLQGKWKPYTDS